MERQQQPHSKSVTGLNIRWRCVSDVAAAGDRAEAGDRRRVMKIEPNEVRKERKQSKKIK